MKWEEVSQGWVMKTKQGKTYLCIVCSNGTYVGLRSAVRFDEAFYGIDVTNLFESEAEWIEKISKDDRVFFTDTKWLDDDEYRIKWLESFTLIDKNKEIIFLSKDLLSTEDRIYKF